MSDLYLGVDGGQSATKALIGDSTGRILGRGRAGPCNHVGAAEGRAKLIGAVRGAVGEALEEAGERWARTRFRAACFGMSGGPADKREILAELIAAERLDCLTDADTALLGGTAGRPGAVVIAGTGSIALARDAQGRTARAGGWGYVFGDEGGAFDIVRRALRAALRQEEGWGPETELGARLLDACRASDANDLMHRFYTEEYPRSRVAALAPLVDETARDGDRVAREILRQAGRALAGYGAAVRGKLFAPDEATPVVHVGGAFRSDLLRESFLASFADDPGARPGPPCYGPEVGALLGAYRLAGVVPPEIREEEL